MTGRPSGRPAGRRTPETAREELAAHVGSLDLDNAGEKVDLTPNVFVICPDDGKQVAFRGCCPKCGGRSWLPAGRVGAIRAFAQEQAALDNKWVGEELAKDLDRRLAAL